MKLILPLHCSAVASRHVI